MNVAIRFMADLVITGKLQFNEIVHNQDSNPVLPADENIGSHPLIVARNKA